MMATPPPSNPSDEQLTQQLQLLKTQLNKKQTFESSLSSIHSLLLSTYPSSSLPIRTLFYDVVCRVATVLRTRYTFPAYLSSGLQLLQSFNRLAVNSVEKSRIQSLINDIQQTLVHHHQQQENGNVVVGGGGGGSGGYLFEGHLTVDPEPPQPNWLVQQNLLTALATTSGSSNAIDAIGDDDDGNAGSLMRRLVESMEISMMENLEELLPRRIDGERLPAPPASKQVVEKLPVIKVEDEEALKKKFGDEGGECCICKEKLVLGDEMQEMPCKHLFHPLCLKPWLDVHNSCPICRHELPTDDHKYESWKEREKELEEERRGAANAVREGEFMYI